MALVMLIKGKEGEKEVLVRVEGVRLCCYVLVERGIGEK